MATNQFVPKSELFVQLRTIFTRQQSGMLTLLTDAKKSVMMRFSYGELTSARCRSWDISNTIGALLEAETVKFTYTSNNRGEDKPPLMAADDFMRMVEPGGSGLQAEPEQLGGRMVIPEQAVFEPKQQPAKTVVTEQKKKEDKLEVDKVTAARMNYF